MEPTEFNLCRQCGGGEALRDSATLLEVLSSGEVIGPDKRTMQSFALINVKATPQIPTAEVRLSAAGFFLFYFIYLYQSFINQKRGKVYHRSSSHWSDFQSVITGLLYTPLAFVKAILSHFLLCM